MLENQIVILRISLFESILLDRKSLHSLVMFKRLVSSLETCHELLLMIAIGNYILKSGSRFLAMKIYVSINLADSSELPILKFAATWL